MSNALIRPTHIGLNVHPSPFIELISAYHTHAGKGYFHPSPKGNLSRSKDCFVFYRNMQGTGLIKTVNGDFTLREKDAIIVRNADKLSLSCADEWRYYSVFFYAENLRLPLNSLFTLPLLEKEEEILNTLISLLSSGEFLNGAKASAILQIFLCDFLSKIHATKNTDDSSPYAETMRETAQYIRENLTQPLSVESLAKRCSFSKNHFCSVFKSHFSVTPKAYILWAKLEKAKLLLKGTDMPVAEISDELCFYSPAHFAYAFKKQYGVTPMEYRKKR